MSNLKRLKRLYGVVIICFIATLISCEYDYDTSSLEYDKQVVVNSIITPDSIIKAKLYWSCNILDTLKYEGVSNFDAKIYEDDFLIFEGINLSDSIVTSLHPKEDSKYKIEIDVPNYNKITAETYIPIAPKGNIEFIEWRCGDSYKENLKYRGYYHFNIDKVEAIEQTRAILVRAIAQYDNRHLSTPCNQLNITNAYCDQFNVLLDNYNAEYKGSAIHHEFYIRVPYKNINTAMPLLFSVGNLIEVNEETTIYNEEFDVFIPDVITHSPKNLVIELINPSDEYDKYLKSAYKQFSLGSLSVPFGTQVAIESNIKGGLGVFAGYSRVYYNLKIEE